MLRLDPTKPYSAIYGLPGLAFQQDGKTFNGRGELVTDTTTIHRIDVEEVVPEENEDDLPRCYEAKDDVPVKAEKNFDDMHWKQLQFLLKTYGEEYTSREAAIAFLKGHK